MDRITTEGVLMRTAKALAGYTDMERAMAPAGVCRFPQVDVLEEIIGLVRLLVFPDFFDNRHINEKMRTYHLGVKVERLYQLLAAEIDSVWQPEGERRGRCGEVDKNGADAALRFIDMLPELRRVLLTDIEAMYHNDPAADNYAEIILSYPVVKAMLCYRVAHALHGLGIPVIPRVITELAHSATGIDINPGAQIGEYFAIDHGTGVVIGETCIIGDHVILYQGVTLGAKNFSLDSDGHPMNIPRHPIIEDNVTIYSNSTILGRITVGHGSVIGGNVWLTHSVPPGSRILQRRAVATTFTDGLGI